MGLAGLRVGYAIAHEQLVALVNKIRQPFNANTLAQTAAIAALSDQEFVRQSQADNDHALTELTKLLARQQVPYIASVGNFISLHLPQGACDSLLEHGIIARSLASYGLSDWVRITTPARDQLARVTAAISAIVA